MTKKSVKHVVLSIVAVACFAVHAHASADVLDKYRLPCSSSQLKDIQDAVAKATQLAKSASAVLPPKDSSVGTRFRRWFGGPDGNYDAVVKAVYDDIPLALVFSKFWCLPPNSTVEEFFHTNAFIPRGGVGEIFVTSNFFQLPGAGVASRGGTIVHEASHQSSKRKIVDDDITGDGKNDYGVANAQARAKMDAGMARANADNYKYFAEDVVYGIP